MNKILKYQRLIKIRIKITDIYYIILLLLLISFPMMRLLFFDLNIPHEGIYKQKYSNQENIKASNTKENETILPDKVYTILAPFDTLIFQNLTLEGGYDHNIYIEIVSPHNCSLEIRILDPDQKEFVIFEEELIAEDNFKKYYNIPFGTALSGNYTLIFIVNCTENLNLYVKMEKTSKCLYDKLSPNQIESLVFYSVNRCENNTQFSHIINLKSDTMYNFYIGRVSAISIKLNGTVRIDCQIIDPNGTPFNIFRNKELPSIRDLEIFSYGTAFSGRYIFSLNILCEVEYINLAYCITKDYKISEEIGANETDRIEDPSEGDNNSTDDIPEDEKHNNKTESSSDPENATQNSTSPITALSLPKEWLIGSVIFFGTLIITMVCILIIYKKKNRFNVDIKTI